MTSLHLGCGPNSKRGDVGVDLLPGPAVDVVHDLTEFPWPLPDASFDHILCENVLEHLPDLVQTMEEIWRVSTNGALVDIQVPPVSSSDFFTDPTHVRAFGARSFDYFDPSRALYRYGYSHAKFHVERVRYESHRGKTLGPFDSWLEHLANSKTDFYENRLIFLLPMRTLYVRLRAVRPV